MYCLHDYGAWDTIYEPEALAANTSQEHWAIDHLDWRKDAAVEKWQWSMVCLQKIRQGHSESDKHSLIQTFKKKKKKNVRGLLGDGME